MSGNNFFPVQRVAQACLQCRRKKCRCTGDRPICGHCGRLGIDCVYDDDESVQNPQRQSSRTNQEEETGVSPGHGPATECILKHLSAIGDKLDTFGRRLDNIEASLAATRTPGGYQDGFSPLVASTSRRLEKQNGFDVANVAANQDVHLTSGREQGLPSLADDDTPEDAVMAAVDAYFYYCHNQPYSFFHEGRFRRHWAEQKVPAHLALTIMATAIRFCTHAYFQGCAYEASIEYANRAWKLIVSDCFTVGKITEVSIVQTVALLGLFDFTAGRSRHASASVKVGMAVRIAQDCGLMLETATQLPYVEQEERRRVFWSVYLLDRLVSCGRNRPPAIVDAACQLQLPCEESIWKEGLWCKTQALDEITNRSLSPPPRQGPFAQLIIVSQILGRSSQYMLQEYNIRSPHPPWDPSSDFAALESDLLHFETSLEIHRSAREILSAHVSIDGVVDYHNSGPILFSRALYHLSYCLLNHPFLLRRRIDTCRSPAPVSFLSRSLDLGWLHAQQLVEFVREARELGCSFHSSASGYCFTVAGSIIALRTYDSDPSICQKAQTLLDEVLAYLDLLSQHWNNVSSMAVVLRRMVFDGFLGSNLCSRQSQITQLTLSEEDSMWAVVDYNKMSGELTAEATGNGQVPVEIWPESMTEMFGAIIS